MHDGMQLLLALSSFKHHTLQVEQVQLCSCILQQTVLAIVYAISIPSTVA